MAIKPRATGIPRVTAYAQLSSFITWIVTSMTGNTNFATPDPALATLTTAQVNLDAAIAAWGPVGARGSHLDLMNLRSAALVARNLLVQEQGYVLNTVVAAGGDYAAQTAALISSGFSAKRAGLLQGLLGPPENFHQLFRNNISPFFVGLDWEKPIGLNSPGNVKNYQIWLNNGTNDFTDAGTVCIGTTTKTSFINRSPDFSVTQFYWCTASNAAGIGAPTAAVIVAPIP